MRTVVHNLNEQTQHLVPPKAVLNAKVLFTLVL
jgi:hypothetical protein